MKNALIFAVLIMNFISFCLYGADKKKARRDNWRIPEKTLLLSAVFGPYGALIGMKVFHHKTRKRVFAVIVPLLAILWTLLLVFCVRVF